MNDLLINLSIIFNLGDNTFGHEFSYKHPCIVIYNELKRVFVVPCTSQTARRDSSGKLYPEFMEGLVSDGFTKTTAIMLNEAKFIDKTRIISTVGTVSKPFYNSLYDNLFKKIFESKYFSIKKLNEFNDLKDKELVKLKNDNESLTLELNEFKKQHNILLQQYNVLKSITKVAVDTTNEDCKIDEIYLN